jgi:hypothetical protein
MSAAYAILSSASQCYAVPRGHVASIGVISVHLERSQQNAMLGLTYTVFRAGERKADFNPYEKLPPEAAQKQLASMDRTRQVFVDTVARNRPTVTAQAALDTQGQWYDPEDGLELGLIDGIATFEQVFEQLAASLAVPPDLIEAPSQPEAPIDPEEAEEAGEVDPPIDPEDETGLTGILKSEGEGSMAEQNRGGGNPPAPIPAAGATVVDFTQPEARAVEIAGLCKMAGFSADAPDFIMSGLTVPEVRAKLTDMQAERSNSAAGEVSNVLPGKAGGATAGGSGLGAFVQQRPSADAIASWTPHLKAAQATNPKFANRQ